MKKNFVLAAFVALFAFAISAAAQDSKAKCVNFSGDWKQDLSEQMAARFESVTLTIKHDCAAGTFETSTARKMKEGAAAPAGGGGGAPAGGGNGAGRGAGGGGGFGGGAPMPAYKLDGKETEIERQGPNGPVKMKIKAEQSGNKITISTTAPGPNGDMTRTSTYELSSDGKTLTQSGGQNSTTYKKA